MGRTISTRLSEAETEALDALARQKGVSRSQLLASIARQAVNTEAKHAVDNVDTQAKQDEDTQAKQAEKVRSILEDDALCNVFVTLPRPFTCPECGETSRCATLCPICGKLELHGCSEECPANYKGWFLSEMYH